MVIMFLLRLWAVTILGLLIGFVVGAVTEKPEVAVATFLLWTVLNKRMVMKEDKTDAHD